MGEILARRASIAPVRGPHSFTLSKPMKSTTALSRIMQHDRPEASVILKPSSDSLWRLATAMSHHLIVILKLLCGTPIGHSGLCNNGDPLARQSSASSYQEPCPERPSCNHTTPEIGQGLSTLWPMTCLVDCTAFAGGVSN